MLDTKTNKQTWNCSCRYQRTATHYILYAFVKCRFFQRLCIRHWKFIHSYCSISYNKRYCKPFEGKKLALGIDRYNQFVGNVRHLFYCKHSYRCYQ